VERTVERTAPPSWIPAEETVRTGTKDINLEEQPSGQVRQFYMGNLESAGMEFVVIADHSPGDCPSSNAKVRAMMGEAAGKLPALAKSLKVEPLFMGAPMVDHKLFFVLRAQSYEAVRDFLMKSGLVQTQTAHIYPTLSIEEALKQASELPPLH